MASRSLVRVAMMAFLWSMAAVQSSGVALSTALLDFLSRLIFQIWKIITLGQYAISRQFGRISPANDLGSRDQSRFGRITKTDNLSLILSWGRSMRQVGLSLELQGKNSWFVLQEKQGEKDGAIKRGCLRLLQLQRNKNNNLPMLKTLPLAGMFKDQTYAWQLLQSEILIETVQQPEGQDISNLLQLYMRGVQVMNTCLDPRESYFRSKVTALMAKNTVRKTFKAKQEEPPKPVEAKQEEVKPEPKKTMKKDPAKKSTDGFVSASALQQKKKELELRLAYATEQHNPEGLRKIIAQNKESQIKLVSKVQKIMQSHEEKLNERINRRKLKTATYRSRADDQSETLQVLDQDSANANVSVPISNQPPSLNQIPQVIAESPSKQDDRKLYKSADAKQQPRSKENSERKEENKEVVPRDRRLSVHLLRVC